MTTATREMARTLASRYENRRCCICGQMMTIPTQSLNRDGQEYCDACYRDCFFVEAEANRHQILDCCAF